MSLLAMKHSDLFFADVTLFHMLTYTYISHGKFELIDKPKIEC